MRRAVVLFLLFASGCSGCGDNTSVPDAGPPPGTEEIPETLCETLAPSSQTCTVTAGTSRTTLVKGIVLTPTRIYRGGGVAIDELGQISCVGCDCAAANQTVVTCPDGAISPGLVNTHDHITYTHNQPYADNGVRYEHRHQWRKGQDTKPAIPYLSGATSAQISWGELRFLMGGATSIVGGGGARGLLRNLDSVSQNEGLPEKAVDFDTFPLGDSGGTRRTDNCNYGTARTAANIMSLDAYEPHTSEGIDASAHNEFLCESSTTYDTMTPGVSNNLTVSKTAMIHAIGLLPADYKVMAQAGTALIWSPRSNITLYGDTARVTTADRLGVEIALGTDWMPSGSMNLLRELRCADSLNQGYYGKHFSDAALWRMVTSNAAAAVAMDDAIGLLAPGRQADLAVFNAHGKTFRAVIDAEPQDVALVMRGGKVLYGDDAVVSPLAQQCDTVDVCGSGKRVCLMSEVGRTYAGLQTEASLMLPSGLYPAFVCGAPPKEPSCTPVRTEAVNGSSTFNGAPTSGDDDGDGIANAQDKCPTVFDPIRPMDNGMHADADGDGVGDACDPCPLDANTETCESAKPTDRDGDGVPNATDNCAEVPNPDQADADKDAKGNSCDACPMDANPGTIGCPTTIYKIKTAETKEGEVVRLKDVLVTGQGKDANGSNNGFFVQVKMGDPGYSGPDNSGLFIFTGSSPLRTRATVGSRVTIDGRVAKFQGQLQLDTVTNLIVSATGEAAPDPVPATYAEVKTGGPRAMALESVLVSLPTGTVTAVNPAIGELTLAVAPDSVIVDDFLFGTPIPPVDQTYTAVTGILAFRQMASKLQPRGAADLTLGPPIIAMLTPALTYARVGTTTNLPTFPTQLAVSLSAPAVGDTVITVTSNNAALTVADVTIPNGMTSAVIPVTAVSVAADVTITARLAAKSLTSHVRVVGAADPATTVTLSPAALTTPPGSTAHLTVTLDIPSPAGGTVVALALAPPTAGTIPATVTVLEDQVSATFDYVDASTALTATVTATLGASTSTATLVLSPDGTGLRISQVFGGGGNLGAPLNQDFIEIFNPTEANASTAGMSVQYTSSTGPSGTGTWIVTPLPMAIIPPGGYFLIAEASGTNGASLPTPDLIAATPITMSATSGKVILVNSTVPSTGTCPTTNVVDLLGYGPAVNCSESAPTSNLSNTTAALRGDAGCNDTNDNSTDFSVEAPAPRNSMTPTASCN